MKNFINVTSKTTKGLLTITIIFLVTLLVSASAPNVNAKTSEGPIPPNIPGAVFHSSLPSLPKDNSSAIRLKVTPLAHDLIHSQNGSIIPVDNIGRNVWWYYDFWNTYYVNPDYMTATFVAVNNTINGLGDDGLLMYLPINVLYGTSTDNSVWFQFEILFQSSGQLPTMTIWDNLGPGTDINYDYKSHDVPTGTVPYIIGDTYYVSVSPEGDNNILFYIQDKTSGAHWQYDTWDWAIPSTTMLSDDSMFSPCSAIEGHTYPAQSTHLSNVPYFQSSMGNNIPAHQAATGGDPAPSGVGTSTYGSPGGPGSYIWEMESSDVYYVSSIPTTNGYGNFGYGSVSNPGGLIGSYADGNYAWIYGGNYGDGGWIEGNMNTYAGGRVSIIAYSNSGYYSNVYAYVSFDGTNWYLVGEITVTGWSEYSLGTINMSFKYVMLCGYDQGDSVALNTDILIAG